MDDFTTSFFYLQSVTISDTKQSRVEKNIKPTFYDVNCVFEFCSVCLILWRVENASDFNDFEANISSQWWFQLLFCWLYIKCFDLDSATFFRCGSYIFTSLMMPSKKSVILLYMITSVFDLIVTAVFFLNIVDQQDVNCVFELLCVVGNYFSKLWNL